jgi:hypothetical protein
VRRPTKRRTRRLLPIAAFFLRGPVAIGIAVLSVLVLGYWGYSELPGRDYSASDNLYRALQLFNGGAELPRSGTPWQLEIARWLAPATVAYAAFAAFFSLARQEVQRVRTRMFARNHVLIIGLGARGGKLAQSLRERYRVVVIERDATNGAANTLRHLGVPVLIGDARDPAVLRTARAGRAAHIVVLTPTDTLNLQIAAALTRVTAGSAVAHHVTIDSPILWEELHRIPLDRSAAREVEFVSIPDRIAVALIGAAVDHWVGGGDDGVQVLVRGEGPAAARLVVHMLRTQALGPDPEIMIASDDHPLITSLVRRADPWILEHSRMTEVPGLASGAAERCDVAFVCGVPEATALSESIEIARELTGGAHVYTAVDDEAVGDALTGAGVDLDRLTPVAASDAVLSDRLLEGRATELLARGRHADQLLDGIASGQEAGKAWDRIPAAERASHRRLAAEIADELGELGADLVPLRGPPSTADLPLSGAALDQFGRTVHERWIRAEREAGSPVARGPHSPDWDHLPETERERIRAEIRSLPSMLARAGYELRLPEEG